MKPILLCSEDDALEALEYYPHWALLSIRDPELEPLPVGKFWTVEKGLWKFTGTERLHLGPRLDLGFDDWPTGDGKGVYSPPQMEHAQKIIEFGHELLIKEHVPGLIVHCAAGISRSSAATVGILASWGVELDKLPAELERVRAFTEGYGFRDETPVRPNPRLVALLDAALQMNGEMLRVMLENQAHTHRWTFEQIKEDAKR